MQSLKDKFYNWAVRKNENVRYEYERYVMEHILEHHEHKLTHWKILWKLNYHYRIKRESKPLLFFENKVENKFLEPKEILKDENIKENKINENSKRAPYMEGAESGAYKRPAPYHFVKALLQADIISFDIFDTLILRPFDRPNAIFDIVGKHLDFPIVFNSFSTCRQNAEKECRKNAEERVGSREITIYDIYKEMERSTGINAEDGIKEEVDTELCYCMANPYFRIVFDILLSQGKTIVLTSDMYLPEKYIKQIVEKCGFVGYKKVYVSCEYKCNKRSGELFRRIMDDYPDKRIIHVGDDYQADILGAKKAGIEAKHYKSNNEIGKQYRAEWMSSLVGSAYMGIVNNYLHNGVKEYSLFYEYGFVYGGIYIFGFCNWLKKKARQDEIEKIIFLARDGDIYQKIFHKYFDHTENEYVYWSRFTNMKYLIEMNQNAFIERIIKHKGIGTQKIELASIFESLSLEFPQKALRKYGLYKSTIITSENQDAIIKFVKNYWNDIVLSYSEERKMAVEELKQIIGDNARIAVVDVGWTGSGPIGFKTVVEKYVKKDCVVKCYMAGASSYYGDGKYTDIMYLADEMDSYMFGMMKNRRNEQIHYTTNLSMTNNAAFEQFTQAQYPSYVGIDNQGKYLFDIPEIENYEITGAIHKGILDFCDIYMKIFEKDPFMYQISGWDAYRPFAFLANHSKYIEKNFKDITFAYGFGGNNKSQHIETMGERADDYYAKKRG